MGSVLDTIRDRTVDRQRVVMLGLDDAGKSTILYSMNLTQVTNIRPTIGFNVEEVFVPNTHISFIVWDLGGQQSVRALWRNYLEDVSGLVFVVDAARSERLVEAKEAFQALLLDPNLTGVPIAIAANKQDLIGAKSAQAISEFFNVATRSNCEVYPTAALTKEGVENLFIDLARRVRMETKKRGSLINRNRGLSPGVTRRSWRERVSFHMPQFMKRDDGAFASVR